jgi:thiamine biosynthesis lipoprotein
MSSPPTDLNVTFRAMATDVHVRVVDPRPDADAAVEKAVDVFHRVEAGCTRFDPESPLMIANATSRDWHEVPAELYDAVAEAERAHIETSGLFDPRVLRTLQDWGYDRSLPFRDGPVALDDPHPAPTGRGRRGSSAAGVRRPQATRRRWRPGLDTDRRAVRIGAEPIDLGGIGKGLAVRWAAAALAGAGAAALVEAGGDCHLAGPGPDPDATGWRVAVEDPRAEDANAEPLAVLEVADAGCATSSVRIRRWRVGGRDVHHLVDPRTGDAGGRGLLAVTVVDPDPAWAEVWSKALFLAGRGNLRSLADERGIAALWVDEDGVAGTSRAMKPHVIWEAPRGW